MKRKRSFGQELINNATDICSHQSSRQDENDASSPKHMLYNLRDDEVPEWLRSPYLTSGYRYGGTLKECYLGLFRWHNETLNAWTMLASLFTGSFLMMYYLSSGDIKGWNKVPFLTHWLCQAIHHPFSINYHLVIAHSKEVAYRARKYDMSLICLLTLSGTFCVTWVSWGQTIGLLITLMNVPFCVYGINQIFALQPGKPLNKLKVTMTFGITLLVYYIAVISNGYKALINNDLNMMPVTGLMISVFGHITSTGMYVAHFPERFTTPVFNNWITSHILFHILITGVYNFCYVYMHSLLRC